MNVTTKIYLHSDKSDMEYNFTELCNKHNYKPSKDAVENSAYAGYEVIIDVEWNLKTGNCKLIGTCKE